MKAFYPSGYGYDRSDDGYVISKCQIPSRTSHRYIDVWSAFHGIPPDGERIMNGDESVFYSQADAIAACERHQRESAVAEIAHIAQATGQYEWRG